jgi:hypothetical protein
MFVTRAGVASCIEFRISSDLDNFPPTGVNRITEWAVVIVFCLAWRVFGGDVAITIRPPAHGCLRAAARLVRL